MPGYLTLEEAAERMGVEYKTLYRLVRSGDLPAGRIGRLYRISEEDLQQYFEKQKTSMANEARKATPVEMKTCCVCGNKLASALSIAGACQETGGPICQACWHIKGIRTCSGETATVPLTTFAGSAHKPAGATATVEQMVTRLRQQGRGVITAADLASSEAAFIRAFGQRLEGIKTLPDPVSGTVMTLSDARSRHELSQPAGVTTEGPGNTISRFTIKTGGWGQPKSALCLEARFLARPAKITKETFDADPIDETELLPLLGVIAEQAAKYEWFQVALIGSPTGFTDSARRVLTDAGRAAVLRDAKTLVALLDLNSGKVVYDTTDPRVTEFLPLLNPGHSSVAD